jgi:hypothetical protein
MADIEIYQGDNYALLEIDLSTAHTNAEVDVGGRSFSVLYTNGTGTIRFDRQTGAPIPLERVATLEWPDKGFRTFYLTNSAQSGATATILISLGPAFRVNPGLLGVADVTDRPARQLGVGYGWQDAIASHRPIPIAGNDGLMVSPKPWWCHQAYGRVILLDDFSTAFKWLQGGSEITRASDTACTLASDFAAKIPTGAVAGNTLSMWTFTMPLTSSLSYATIELWWMLYAAATETPRYLSLEWTVKDPNRTEATQFGFKYLNYNSSSAVCRPQYLTSAGTYSNLSTSAKSILITNPQWHHTILQIKRPTSARYQYDFIQFDDAVYDLDGVAGASASWDAGQTFIAISVVTDAAAVTTGYIGAIIVHQGNYGYPEGPG